MNPEDAYKKLSAPLVDDPELDATDFAHPAWWRGHEHTTVLLCGLINKILDGKDDMHGVCREPWESTRNRIYRLRYWDRAELMFFLLGIATGVCFSVAMK